MDETIMIRTWVARRWWQRARGLLGRPVLAPGAGMLFPDTASVHGFGMRHALDLVFLDARHRVLRCCTLPRWGVRLCRGASAVLELRAGEIARLGIRSGQRLTLVPVGDVRGLFREPLAGRPASVPVSRPIGALVLAAMLAASGLSGWATDAVAARSSGAGISTAPQGSTSDAAPGKLTGTRHTLPARSHATPQVQMPVAMPTDKTLDAALLEAERLYREGQDEEALSLFGSLVALSGPHREQALFRIGNLHQRRGESSLALDAYWRLMALVTDEGAGAVMGRPTPAQRQQQARQLKAMINANLLAVEQVGQSLAWIGQLQQDAGVRAAAGLDEAMAGQISQQLWQHSERIRQLMESLGAWEPQTTARSVPLPPARYPVQPMSHRPSGRQRVTIVYDQPPRRNRKAPTRTRTAPTAASLSTAPAASVSTPPNSVSTPAASVGTPPNSVMTPAASVSTPAPSASTPAASAKPEILTGGQSPETPPAAGESVSTDADMPASGQSQSEKPSQQQATSEGADHV